MKDLKVLSSHEWWSTGEGTRTILLDRPDVADILRRLGGSLLVTSRSDSLLSCLSAFNSQVEMTVIKLPGPMGVAYNDGRLAIGCTIDIRTFVDISGESEEGARFVATGSYITGAVSVHDVAWGEQDDIWFVNTRFSSICTIENGVGFRTRWKPSFIKTAEPIDACHLNGAVVEDGKIRYATALGMSGKAESWRETGPDLGVVLDAESKLVCDEISLPHSPVLDRGSLYFLEAGRGRLIRFDGTAITIAEINAVARGLAITPTHYFVGGSCIRRTSDNVAGILVKRFPNALSCKVVAISRDTGAAVSLDLAHIREVSSVHFIPEPRVRFVAPDAQQRAETFIFLE